MTVLRIIGIVAVTLATLGLGFVVAMRAKYEPAQTAIRRMNKRLWNPRALRTAGGAGSTTSIVRHVGRSSGTSYETPVAMYRSGDELHIALPYGTATDWIRNLTAACGGEVVHDGETHTVGAPDVVPLEDLLEVIPAGEQRTLRAFKVDQVLSLPILDRVA